MTSSWSRDSAVDSSPERRLSTSDVITETPQNRLIIANILDDRTDNQKQHCAVIIITQFQSLNISVSEISERRQDGDYRYIIKKRTTVGVLKRHLILSQQKAKEF